MAEIATNIVRHAYPPDSPHGTFHLRLTVQVDGLVACFTDDGIEWAPVEPRPVDPQALPEGGLGLIVARAALDRLDYHRDTSIGENAWRLTKGF